MMVISGLLLLAIVVGCLAVEPAAPASVPPTVPPSSVQAQPTRVREQDGAVMVYIPAGQFLMGSSEADIEDFLPVCPNCRQEWYAGEKPQHSVYLKAFWIDKYEVSNEQYARFIAAGGYQEREFWTQAGWEWKERENRTRPTFWEEPRWNKPHYPIVGVSWYEAMAYCRWVEGRLPTEAEWEKAASWDARRGKKRRFPWGDKWEAERCNTAESALGGTTPVGKYCPAAESPCGVCNLAGNVWEWCSSLYRPYPYDARDGREDPEAEGTRVLRGGSWINTLDYARTTYRLGPFPGDFILFDADEGFRVVIPAPD